MGLKRTSFIDFLRDWMLPIAIVLGIGIAFLYHAVPALHRFGHIGHTIVADGQRWVIAILLFCQFVKISPHDLQPRRWHLWILLFQILAFVGCALLARFLAPGGQVRILVECKDEALAQKWHDKISDFLKKVLC